MTTCIYCRRKDDITSFKGVEHVIPQAFGKFGPETPTLNCVCDDCNGWFGKNLDIFLARETVEGIVRYSMGIRSSEARPQKYLSIKLEEGPETGQFAGMKIMIDGTTGELMKPRAQFQILNQRTGKIETYLRHQIDGLKLPASDYGRPGDGSSNGTWECCIYAMSKQEHDEIVDALRSNGIAFMPGASFQMPEVNSTENFSIPVAIEGEVTDMHRRAHAKIFLNFIAKFLGCEEALRPHWDFLRQFARYGRDKIKYRMLERPFESAPDSEALHIIRESISVRVENLRGHVVGSIQFYGNQIYQFILRENEALPDDHIFGYCFTNGQVPRRLYKGVPTPKNRGS